MDQSWRVLLLCSAAVLSLLHGVSANMVNCATGTGNLQNNFPLPSENVALHLLPNSSTSSNGNQVIVPQMAFGCSGRITAWTAHTLIITLPNFVEVLTHRITMQVWRPSPSNPGQYSLVGANVLTFTGAELTNGIKRKTSTTEMAYFSFTKNLTENEKIYFAVGDMIGWYEYPPMSIAPPLSVLYRKPFRNDSVASVVRLLVDRTAQESCSLCDAGSRLEAIDNVVPLVSVDFRVGQDLMTCSGSCNNSDTQSGPASTPPLATPTSSLPPDSNSTGQSATPQRNLVTTSKIVCIVIAAFTMVMHIVLIMLCSMNFVILKEIRKKLNGSVVPQSRRINMAPASNSNQNVSNETSADYEANPNAPTVTITRDYETVNQSPSSSHLDHTYDSIDGSKNMDRSNSMHLQVLKKNTSGTESPAWSRSENSSLNGSRVDLINCKV